MTIGIRFAARSDVGLLREGNEDSATPVRACSPSPTAWAATSAVRSPAPPPSRRSSRSTIDVPGERARRRPETGRAPRQRDACTASWRATRRCRAWARRSPRCSGRAASWPSSTSATPAPTCSATASCSRSPTTTRSCSRWSTRAGSASTRRPRTRSARCCCARSTAAARSTPTSRCARPSSGDRYLLCSDGLSRSWPPETIHQALSSVAEPEQAVRQLIDLANRGGGPDNITCVVADVVELESLPGPPLTPIVAGAAHSAGRTRGEADTRPAPGGAMAGESPAHRAAALREPQPSAVTIADMKAVPRSTTTGCRRCRHASASPLALARGSRSPWWSCWPPAAPTSPGPASRGSTTSPRTTARSSIFQGMNDKFLGQNSPT